MGAPPAKLFAFGPYRLDLEQHLLLRDGKPVPLAPKAMTILCVLVENHGELVEREELLRRAWPNVFVEEGNLSVNIFALRKVLAEGLDNTMPIETVPKRGYRFIASVSVIADAAAPLDVNLSPQREAEPFVEARSDDPGGQEGGISPAGAPRLKHASNVLRITGLTVLLAIGIFLYFHKSAAHVSPSRISMVVLPFQDLTGNPSGDYLPDSFTEELITRLASDYGSELEVLGRDTTLSYVGKRETPQQIARELRVQYAIEGSIRSERSHIRVTVRLVSPASQSSLWASSYDGDASQVLQFEDSVARSVGKELSLRLLAGRRAEHIPRSESSYNDYLQGLHFLSQRTWPAMERALESFAAASAGDPLYARAFAELAVTYNLMGEYG